MLLGCKEGASLSEGFIITTLHQNLRSIWSFHFGSHWTRSMSDLGRTFCGTCGGVKFVFVHWVGYRPLGKEGGGGGRVDLYLHSRHTSLLNYNALTQVWISVWRKNLSHRTRQLFLQKISTLAQNWLNRTQLIYLQPLRLFLGRHLVTRFLTCNLDSFSFFFNLNSIFHVTW